MSSNDGNHNKASSLLASLTGDEDGFPLAVDNGTDATAEQDLFGDVPIDSPPPKSKSLLASSGLLGEVSNSSGGGSGLFDEVDKLQRRQEQEEEKRHEQEKRRQMEELQQQQQEEEQRRLQQQQQQMQQQQQAYAQQQMQQQQMQLPQQQAAYPPLQQQPLQQQPLPPQQQQQPTPGNTNPLVSPTQGGFYRNHQAAPLAPQNNPAATAPTGSYVYSTTGGTVQSHTIAPAAHGRYTATTPSIMAGLNNSPSHLVQPPVVYAPPSNDSLFGKIKVSDPMLTSSGGMFGSPPHWTYQVQTELKADLGGFWIVRRRFRHVVALEERLRQDCPGAILPPRPEKHATRAIEEASSTQSAEFATHRAAELEVYLNALAQHPIAGKSSVLRLFLALQDDVGTAWPEVSSNAITRLTNVTAGAALKISESTADAATHLPWSVSSTPEIGEDSAELLALASTEHVRMGAVTQAVPKLEGAVTLLKEEGERSGAVGIEMGKLCKDVEGSDRDLSVPLEILSNGLLRHGRRTKRLALELSAALEPYVLQYKLCRYEKAAFSDRRAALGRKQKQRLKADATAQRLVVVQRSGDAAMQLDRMEAEASVSDKVAVDAVQECDQIGEQLKAEVNRVAFERRSEWSKSIKIIASSMKEAATERAAVWEATRDAFYQAFPEDQQTEAGQAPAAVGTSPSAGV